jgi:hypothetical protein
MEESAEEDIWAQEGGDNRGVEKTTSQGMLCSVLLTKYHSGDQIVKTEIDRACSPYGGEQRCVQGFSGKI